MVIASTFFFLKFCSNDCFKSLFIRAQLSDVWNFIILRSVAGLTSFNKNNRANVSGEEVSFFLEYAKKT